MGLLCAGRGYLKGTQGHLHFLPERHTDFAFSVWAEEWGFGGCLFFLAVYFFMILWGLNVCLVSRDKFGVLLAFGIVALIFWQAVINLLMVMGFLPVVGIPLPMFSYGGSSLMTTLVGIGLLDNPFRIEDVARPGEKSLQIIPQVLRGSDESRLALENREIIYIDE